MRLTRAQRRRLPKARLFWVRWWSISPIRRARWFAKFRNANAMFVWIGRLEIGWRMPWLERAARACHPHLFTEQQGENNGS